METTSVAYNYVLSIGINPKSVHEWNRLIFPKSKLELEVVISKSAILLFVRITGGTFILFERKGVFFFICISKTFLWKTITLSLE